MNAGIGQSRKLREKVRRVGIRSWNSSYQYHPIVAQFAGRDKVSASCGIVRM
ncbi:hypothetical protein MJ390_23950 [Klebsiella pneumoniae]|nr:hypothetical protein MJ390_23950 [Klebsiella pneumoniae]